MESPKVAEQTSSKKLQMKGYPMYGYRSIIKEIDDCPNLSKFVDQYPKNKGKIYLNVLALCEL